MWKDIAPCVRYFRRGFSCDRKTFAPADRAATGTGITSILTFCQSNLFINTVMIIVLTNVNQIFSSFFFHRFEMPGYQRETPPPVVEEDGGTVQVKIFIIDIVNYQNCHLKRVHLKRFPCEYED